MQKNHCRECQGSELYDTVLSARNGVVIGRKTRAGDEWIFVRCLVCLNCGFTTPYLDEPGLARLRTWAYGGEAPTAFPTAAEHQNPAPLTDSPAAPTAKPGDFSTIVFYCMILGALLGIVVALYSWFHA